MKKRIRIFGRSIPLSLVLLLVVAAVAAAAWFLLIPSNLYATPATGVEAEWSQTGVGLDCGIYTDVAGDISDMNCWILTGNHRPNMTLTNARPGDVVWLKDGLVSSEAVLDICTTLDPASVDAYAALGVDVTLASENTAIPALTTGTVEFNYAFNASLPEGGPEIDFGNLMLQVFESSPDGICP